MEAQLRNRITAYSFILTLFVIWLHAGECLITNIPGQIAVPGFFVLSGFLFFTGFGAEGTGTLCPFMKWHRVPVPSAPPTVPNGTPGELLKQKLKRRVRSLLIPYLLWNLIYFLICLVLGEAEISEAFQAIFFYSCNPVFWYLYQLILIMALTPFVYLFIRKKAVGVIYLLLIFLAAVRYDLVYQALPWFPLNFDALFYFSFGAFASLHLSFAAPQVPESDALDSDMRASGAQGTGTGAPNGTEEPVPCAPNGRLEALAKRKRRCVLLLGAVTAFVFFTWLTPRLMTEWVNIGVIGQRLTGALSLWFLLGFIPEFKLRPWMTINFFVYATHYLVIRAVWKAEILFGLNDNETVNVIVYLIMPAVCVAAAFIVYLWMRKITPKLLALLTGGRT